MHNRGGRLHRILTVSAGLLLAVTVLLAHRLLPSQPSELLVQTIQSLHGPGFGMVAICMLVLVRNIGNPTNAYAKAALLAIILAGLAEAAQIPGPREAQLTDVLVDALGISGFLGAAALFSRRSRNVISKRWLVLLTLASGAALLLTLLPASRLSYALYQRNQSVPQILSFDHAWEQHYSSTPNGRVEVIQAPVGWPATNHHVARLRSSGQWGIMLQIYPHPDWSEYSAISFVAAAADGKIQQITVSIRDISPDARSSDVRYRTEIMVGPELTRYKLRFRDMAIDSSGRSFDRAHVHAVIISESNARSGIEILLDDLSLEM